MRVGSMFAGIGGICLAFESAGANLVWANEIDEYACATYRHNFNADYLVEGDIRQINLNVIPAIDILTAGFPCQPFSLMGKQKGFMDPRGTMYFEILRVIDAKRPQIVFLENVKNLVKHDSGKTFSTIFKTLSDKGYTIKYAVLGPHTHSDIPQFRDRIFIVAFLDKEECVRFNFPLELPAIRKINDIINRKAEVGSDYYYEQGNKYYSLLSSRMTDTTAIYRIDDSGVAKKAWKICPTLKANMGTYPDRVPLIIDCRGIRKLTPSDCLALQGFPESYRFPDIPKEEMYKQLGNTVCVPLVKRIADNIVS